MLPSFTTEAVFRLNAPAVSILPAFCWCTAPLIASVRPLTPLTAPALSRLSPFSVRFFAAHCPLLVRESACSVALPSAVILLPLAEVNCFARVSCSRSALCIAPLLASDCALSRIDCPCHAPALFTSPEVTFSAPCVSSEPPAALISSRCGEAIAMRAISRVLPSSVRPCWPISVP
ncbi:Uncharacterised protein [Yokenella regensburgei]|uniref:Uncharacterized protein n=1 Tax=Yokenella regensburgei TaxID=158877 RepID=A0AB38FT69_9ENTR|nr:Uncharacterised protein [Yokenella regensburgei]